MDPAQGPCTMNVRNEPVHDMACVVKRGTPPVRRWKLCEFQHGKSISISGINLIGWRALLGRFHLIIPGNQKTEFRNRRSNSRALLPFNQSGFERIRGVVKNNGSHPVFRTMGRTKVA